MTLTLATAVSVSVAFLTMLFDSADARRQVSRMAHRRVCWTLVSLAFLSCVNLFDVTAEDLPANEIIASVDGDPVYVGELNLILAERFQNQPINSIDVDLKRATCHLLAQRRLALRALRKVGGEPLATMVQNEIDAFVTEVRRRGSTLQQQASARSSDSASLLVDLSWRVAWGAYLKSKLTDENLRRYFESHANAYDGTKYRVSQIFMRPISTSAADILETEKTLSSFASEIQTNDDREAVFETLARQHSQSPTAESGGQLGWIESEGDLPAGLVREIRELPIGSVSRPLRSPFGVHLLLVHEIEKGKTSYDELTDLSMLRRDAANALFQNLVETESETKVMWHLDVLKPPTDSQ